MNPIQSPDGFTKAHGVKEGRRRCLNCGINFTVVTDGPCRCQSCGNTNTEPVVEIGTRHDYSGE